MTSKHNIVRAAFTVVMTMIMTQAQRAMAHAGEVHADNGLDFTTTLEVAGVVAALGIAWLLTNRFFRARDAIRGEDDRSLE